MIFIKRFIDVVVIGIYLFADVLAIVILMKLFSVLTDTQDEFAVLAAQGFLIILLLFISLLIIYQIYYFKYCLRNVKFIYYKDDYIFFCKNNRKYKYLLKNIKEVKIRNATSRIIIKCVDGSKTKKYILFTNNNSPFFTDYVNVDELREKLIYSRFN